MQEGAGVEKSLLQNNVGLTGAAALGI